MLPNCAAGMVVRTRSSPAWATMAPVARLTRRKPPPSHPFEDAACAGAAVAARASRAAATTPVLTNCALRGIC